MTIDEFIGARLDEDEQIARAAEHSEGSKDWHAAPAEQRDSPAVNTDVRTTVTMVCGRASSEHIARHDPARVLRQCAALRAAVRHVETMISPSQQIEAEGEVLYPIAAIWSDHPDFQQEWAL